MNFNIAFTGTIKAGRVFLLMALLATPAAIAQQGDTTRDIWNTAYYSATSKPATRKPGKAKTPPRYRCTNCKGLDQVNGETVLGITVWHLRPPGPRDRGERILVQSGQDNAEWIPVRVAASTPLPEGSLVRLTVEAARSGYLYVIDRERYADGTRSEPVLIFPTLTIRSGNHRVEKGQLIELPDREDSIPCFRLVGSRPDQLGEELTVLVTPEPLEGIIVTAEPKKLSEQQVAEWEKKWGAQVGLLEMVNGAGQPWSKAEKEAGAKRARPLKADEPAPQSVFYRPDAKANEPMLVKLQLNYRRER